AALAQRLIVPPDAAEESSSTGVADLLLTAKETNPTSPARPIEDLLVDLIQNSIAPSSWSHVGGQATIQYFPLGTALVLNQTMEVQEEIAALLQSLRRLQERMQVATNKTPVAACCKEAGSCAAAGAAKSCLVATAETQKACACCAKPATAVSEQGCCSKGC